MAILTLKDIGKIYVSDGNVTVGIRGVNLSFEKGEFVAITGKSGSGKSTLLNTISGMDSYEEGELYIEGQSTSHFLQSDWEEYRQKYISFIFQEYNIIDSFTVLQNVELALMHIEDEKKRRKRAMELIEKVGLTSHIKHKGSKLSGGQKQRTVIARALAKDSPIILADEPTGNLDAATSAEIIELLREVSQNKLVIVVTHNFEDFEAYATRHIRIFDGAVAFDHTVKEYQASDEEEQKEEKKLTANEKKKQKKAAKKKEKRDGKKLGKAIFFAKPMLSLFLCILMLVGTAGMFTMTSVCSDMGKIFQSNYMFTPVKGRVVLVKRDGNIFTEEELKELQAEYGAQSYLRFDSLLDAKARDGYVDALSFLSLGGVLLGSSEEEIDYTFKEDAGKLIIGRYPEKSNEVLLCLPISKQLNFGMLDIAQTDVIMAGVSMKVVGLKYYIDNTQTPKAILTEDGYNMLMLARYASNTQTSSATVTLKDAEGRVIHEFSSYTVYPAFDLPEGTVYINSFEYKNFAEENEVDGLKKSITLRFPDEIDTSGYSVANAVSQREISGGISKKAPDLGAYETQYTSEGAIFVSEDLFIDMIEEEIAKKYTQASLFFKNDIAAKKAARKLYNDGYIAVSSDATYKEDKLVEVIGGVFQLGLWSLGTLFLTLFIYLCTLRSIGAFKGDMAIMRSMGISVKTIKRGIYIRMLMSLIPAFVVGAIGAVVIFTNPILNGLFTFLYPWQYALIVIGMTAIVMFVTHKQIKRLFKQSVKKALKGGNR